MYDLTLPWELVGNRLKLDQYFHSSSDIFNPFKTDELLASHLFLEQEPQRVASASCTEKTKTKK